MGRPCLGPLNDKGFKLACEEAYTSLEAQLLEEAQRERNRGRGHTRDRQALSRMSLYL